MKVITRSLLAAAVLVASPLTNRFSNSVPELTPTMQKFCGAVVHLSLVEMHSHLFDKLTKILRAEIAQRKIVPSPEKQAVESAYFGVTAIDEALQSNKRISSQSVSVALILAGASREMTTFGGVSFSRQCASYTEGTFLALARNSSTEPHF